MFLGALTRMMCSELPLTAAKARHGSLDTYTSWCVAPKPPRNMRSKSTRAVVVVWGGIGVDADLNILPGMKYESALY